MRRAGVDPLTIDAVAITHLHGDHFGGLPFLILDAQFSRRERPLLVAGPPGTEARVRAAQEVLFPGSSATVQRFDLRFLELQPESPATAGPATVTAYPVDHASGAPAYALRVAWADRTVVYTGDTAWTETLVRAADGADLLIAEALFFEKQVRFHLDYRTLIAHRDELRCRRLIVTHMSADTLAHRDEIDCECAEDGLEIAL
jgi:ribonuclease BN (tRNA processing enzyme)